MTETNWIARAEKTAFKVFNLIDGKTVSADKGGIIEKFAARNGAKIAEFGEGAAEDVNAAVAAAKRAFDDGRWRRKSVHQRKAILLRLADLVNEHKDEFALNESMDTGKPITKAFGDIAGVSGTIRNAAHSADKVLGPSALDGGIFSYQLRKPVGVVGAIVGWNYPLTLAAQKIAPALVMGNSLVLKPSEFTSLSACRIAELALEAGVPDGVFNVVNGLGATVGDALARHMDVRLLSFTGSSATGKRLMESAGQSNMKKLILECGGKSPFIVFDDYEGDLDKLAYDITVDTAFKNQGALCISSTRILMQKGIREALVPKMLEQTKTISPADPLLPETSFGAIMNEAHMSKVLNYVQSGLEDGAELLTGGERINTDTGGYYLSPAIFDNVKPTDKIAKEEIFGPLAGLFTFEKEEDAIALANDTEYGLAAYAATSNAQRMIRLGRDLEVGSILLISTLSAAPGGINFGNEPWKQSGLNIEGGLAGLAAYTAASQVLTLF